MKMFLAVAFVAAAMMLTAIYEHETAPPERVAAISSTQHQLDQPVVPAVERNALLANEIANSSRYDSGEVLAETARCREARHAPANSYLKKATSLFATKSTMRDNEPEPLGRL